MRRYRLTPTAAANFEQIGRETAQKWDDGQAFRYLSELRNGFQAIAERHEHLPRKATGVGEQRMYRVNHHYIVFWVMTPDIVAITTILHERMDVPTRLRNAQIRTSHEVADVRHAILKDNLSGED